MSDNNLDIEADILAAEDRESMAMIEPLLVRESGCHREILADLSVELTAAPTGVRRSLPDGVVKALSE